MKVLFDCILTKDPPHKCSTTIQFMRLVPLLLQNPDCYIYWPIPDWATDLSQYPQDERIKYWRVPQSKDRTREYNLIRPWLEEALSFTGPLYDWDVLVTVRSAQVPLMKVQAVSPRLNDNRQWSKRVVLIEEMAILSCKPTVAKSAVDIQDRLTLEGWLASDYVFSPSYHEKRQAIEIAKAHFSASRIKDLKEKVKEVCALSTNVMELKTTHQWHSNSDRKMVLVYAGRLETTAARMESVNEVFKNQFILHGEKVEAKILSVSAPMCRAEERLEKDAMEVLHLDRDDFWQMARERMDLALFFHVDGGLLMSIFEPVSFGVPAIVKDALWSRSVFGPDYPFYADNETQAYGLVNAFVEDYDTQYQRFAEWHKNWFVPEYTRRMTEDNLFTCVAKACFDPPQDPYYGGLERNSIVKLLADKGGDEFVLKDKLEELKGELRGLAQKLDEDFDERGLVWGTSWNEFRLGLKRFYGYEDASVKTGHLRKVK